MRYTCSDQITIADVVVESTKHGNLHLRAKATEAVFQVCNYLRLQIWHDRENNKLTIMAQLECTADIERQLLQAEAQMNVVVGRNRKDIIKNSNK